MILDLPHNSKAVTVRLSFYQPDIPQNLGTAIRLSACFGVPIDIIEPCGFPLTDRALRRSVMDYQGLAHVSRCPDFANYAEEASKTGERIVLMTTKGATPLQSFAFQPGDRLLMGRESSGVPDEVHDRADARIIIPMVAGARSINVATAAAIALFEALRQTGGLAQKSQSG